MRSKTAYFGGAFDPIHNGHLGVIEAVAKSGLVDEIIISPSGKRQNGNKNMTDPLHRIVMLNLAILKLKENFNKEFDDNIKNKRTNLYQNDCKITLNINETKQEIKNTYNYVSKMNNPRIVMSLDNANTITTWGEWEQLIKFNHCIIVKRAGEPKFDTWYKDERHSFLNAEIESISSSQIRSLFKLATIKHRNEYGILRNVLPRNVFNYILENNLYI